MRRNRGAPSRNDHRLKRHEVEALFRCGALPEQGEYNSLNRSDVSKTSSFAAASNIHVKENTQVWTRSTVNDEEGFSGLTV